MFICKFFGCDLIKVTKEEPIEVMQKIRYTFYEECKRCKRKLNFNSYTQ